MNYNKFIFLYIFFFAFTSFAENFDLLLVHADKNSIQNIIDNVKVIKNKKVIQKVWDAVEKSESNKYMCGFDYRFDFYLNGEYKDGRSIEKGCENHYVINIIKPYFPDSTDSFRIVIKPIPINEDINNFRKELEVGEYLLLSNESIDRFNKRNIYASGCFSCGKLNCKDCLYITLANDDIWYPKIDSLMKSIYELKPIRIAEFNNGSSDYRYRLGITVWTESLMDDKFSYLEKRYSDIIDSIQYVEKQTYNALLITKNKNLINR